MRKFFALSVIGLAAMLGTAMAADLTVKLDGSRQNAAITNHLATGVRLIYLQGDDNRNYDIQATLNKGATVTVALRHGFPDRVVDAICTMKNPPLNYPVGADGSYHLSVLVE